MNKQQQIAFYKKQLSVAQDLKEVADQNKVIATRIESEAKSALEVLGAYPMQGRKVKYELPTNLKQSVLAGLTK